MLIEFSICSRLVEFLHETSIKSICHIGAHHGQEVEAYSKSGVQRVIWFEANTDLINDLKNNINKYSINQVIIPYALWHENTTLDFYITNSDQSSSFFELDKHLNHYPQIKVEKTRTINAFRFDNLLNLKPSLLPWSDFEFLNIDTQGAELSILKGFGNSLFNQELKAIYLEVNETTLYKGIPLVNEIDQYLMQFGFHRLKTAWSEAEWGDALYLKSFTSIKKI